MGLRPTTTTVRPPRNAAEALTYPERRARAASQAAYNTAAATQATTLPSNVAMQNQLSWEFFGTRTEDDDTNFLESPVRRYDYSQLMRSRAGRNERWSGQLPAQFSTVAQELQRLKRLTQPEVMALQARLVAAGLLKVGTYVPGRMDVATRTVLGKIMVEASTDPAQPTFDQLLSDYTQAHQAGLGADATGTTGDKTVTQVFTPTPGATLEEYAKAFAQEFLGRNPTDAEKAAIIKRIHGMERAAFDKGQAADQANADAEHASTAQAGHDGHGHAEGEHYTGEFYNPIPTGYKVTGKFGDQRKTHRHAGIDLAVKSGTPALAAASGTVVFAGVKGGYGNTVILRDDNGTEYLYAHLSELKVAPGTRVGPGTIVALTGGAKGAPGAGTSSGPHLHFEVRKNGRAVDPTSYFANAGTAQAKQGGKTTYTTTVVEGVDPRAEASKAVREANPVEYEAHKVSKVYDVFADMFKGVI